jgi:serine/threonine protein kinase
MASSSVLPPITERFVLKELEGAGGMGTVYRAFDTHTDHTVAVKLLHASANPKDAERFAREAQLLFELHHPGIVEYLAHGVTADGQPYLAMEWLTGEDLAKRLARGALSLADSLTLLRRIAAALAVAHQKGIVHRDLKPSNLFLRDGEVERVAILDFGIARRREFSHAITGTGGIVGTPAYMAPEQARGERDLTPAVDVFSLGCVLFECLTGRRPFVAEQVMAVLAMILFTEPPRLRVVRPDLPKAVEALLARMLAKATGDRLPDATALLAALASVEDALSQPPATTLAPIESLADIDQTTATTLEMPASIEILADPEQHLVSVLVATSEGRSGGLTASDAGSGTLLAEVQGLAHAVTAYGARVERLADGALVATLVDARGTATDQAAQAARCALLVKARWPGARIAVCTGRGRLRERLPIGEVLDRAMRLLDRTDAPSSDQILLDDVTWGLLDVRFRLGRTASGAHALLGEEVTLDASRPLLGKPTPCVGREAELGMLELVLAGCIEDVTPRAVLVTAPPGAGKSRLRHEFQKRVEGRGNAVQILLGRGDPMSAGSAFSLLGQALRRYAGILDAEDLELRRTKLAQRVSERLPAADREHVIAFLGEICGVAFSDEGLPRLRAARQDPRIMADQITLAMLDFLRAECTERPLLLVLEDLHWGDALTMKLVATMLRELGERPLMVLGLARPEMDEPLFKAWAGVAQPLPLRPLSKKAGERLVHEVLGADLPNETVWRIVEHAAGNALFLEELIRAEAEGRGGQAPETVLAILQARIGRLDAGARRVLRAASVFGESSWVGGILAVLGAGGHDIDGAVQRLTGAEILEDRRESRFPGEREVRFRHVLMRDAAYGLLTTNDRVDGHRAAAQFLEARGEPDALVLAEHFLQGREAALAIPYYVQAAEQSYETNDAAAALAYAERGLRCGAQGAQRGDLLGLEVAVYIGREHYAEVLAAGTEAIDLLPEGSKRWCRTFRHLFPAAMVSQVDLLTKLSSRFARVEPSPDARGEYVCATARLSIVLGIMGEKVAARMFLTRARGICAELDPSEVAWGYLRMAEGTHQHLLEEAPWAGMLSYAEGKRLFCMAGEQRVYLMVCTDYGKVLHELGDHAAAEAELRKNLAAAERLNEPFRLAYAKTYLARLLAGSAPIAELDEPAQLARDAIAVKNPLLLGMAHGALAEISRRQGDLAGAEAEARVACEAARPFPPYSWDLIALRMQILIEQGRAAEALPIGDDAVRELERLGLAGNGELALRLAVAEVHHALGHTAAATTALAVALERLWIRVNDIPEGTARERYLTQVPVNARLIALGRAWLGEDAVRPPASSSNRIPTAGHSGGASNA